MIIKSDGTNFWHYYWDYENRLVRAFTRKKSVRYAYDALGRRVQRYTTADGNTKFIYDGQDVVADDTDGVLTKYQNGLGIDNKLKMITGGNAKYFLTDHLGSTVSLTDASGNVSSSASYDSFGNATGNLTTRYQYTGREYDSFTGLHYYRARFYDGKLGRFISEDPIGFTGGDINLYGYVNNKPLIYVDYDGNSPTLVTGAIGAGIGAAIGGGLVLASGGSWKDAGKAAVVGGIAGGITGLTLGVDGAAIAGVFNGGIIGGAAAGAVGAAMGNLGAQGFQLAAGWKCNFSFKELGQATAFGALTGGLFLRPYTAPNQSITSWASRGNTPDLNPGRWVMTGEPTLGNYARSVGPALRGYPHEQLCHKQRLWGKSTVSDRFGGEFSRSPRTKDYQMIKIDKTLLKNIGKIEIGAIFVIIITIFLSSYYKVNISAITSIEFCKLWIIGILIDMCSLLILAFCIIRKSKTLIALPIIGWMLYFLACICCQKSLFLMADNLSLIGIIILKVTEFLVLSLLHLVLQNLIPAMIEKLAHGE